MKKIVGLLTLILTLGIGGQSVAEPLIKFAEISRRSEFNIGVRTASDKHNPHTGIYYLTLRYQRSMAATGTYSFGNPYYNFEQRVPYLLLEFTDGTSVRLTLTDTQTSVYTDSTAHDQNRLKKTYYTTAFYTLPENIFCGKTLKSLKTTANDDEGERECTYEAPAKDMVKLTRTLERAFDAAVKRDKK